MHYMSDMSMPWHTQSPFDPLQLSTHDAYEAYVQNEFTNSKYGFKVALESARVSSAGTTDPAASARSLASFASSKYPGLQLRILSNPSGWRSDPWVIQTTKQLLAKGLEYNMGLVRYAAG